MFDRFKDPSSGQSVLIEKLQKQVKELVHIVVTIRGIRRDMCHIIGRTTRGE